MDAYHRSTLRQHERRVFRAIKRFDPKPDVKLVEAWGAGEGDYLGRRSRREPTPDDGAPRVIRFFNNKRELKPDIHGKVIDPREPLIMRPRTVPNPGGRRGLQFQPKFYDEKPKARAPTYALGRKVDDDVWLDRLAEKLRVMREAKKKKDAPPATAEPDYLTLADKRAVRMFAGF